VMQQTCRRWWAPLEAASWTSRGAPNPWASSLHPPPWRLGGTRLPRPNIPTLLKEWKRRGNLGATAAEAANCHG
jgi:hypothetical protein